MTHTAEEKVSMDSDVLEEESSNFEGFAYDLWVTLIELCFINMYATYTYWLLFSNFCIWESCKNSHAFGIPKGWCYQKYSSDSKMAKQITIS